MSRRRWPFTADIDQPAPEPAEHPGWARRLVDDNPRGIERAEFVVLDRRVLRSTKTASQPPKSGTLENSVPTIRRRFRRSGYGVEFHLGNPRMRS
jgi:hypothetical protein